ncbi:peroxide stress protein YaaA [Microbacterium protaetiae]|uniref:Peroxide stress protein YaaA n=1 Tax=Microbacterium protaetiae TaxID=2509458 RepID=A0A4P6ECH4_9MICO|nr:peroxide stress protein YaaA [Microbacterium protaetiae]QAY58709.1 peroxide stress protein YaaA [Microbacterium protaetiae]
MLILLPPSETKRSGGRRSSLRLDALALAQLAPQRAQVIDALVSLAADEEESARILKLSPRQRGDIAHNAALRTGPTMPAVDRYTGVLYDALDASGLDAAARRWLGAHVLIHSAPFGPVAALDAIPAYRLAAGTTLPGLPPLRRVWADAVTAAIAQRAPSFVLDLRSEAYAALGPIPAGTPHAYLRVVTDGADGTTRALNHFNKHAKGELVRQLATDRPRIASIDTLRRWADAAGVVLREGAAGELDLVV